MTTARSQRPLNRQVRHEATEWLLRFSEAEVDAAGRREFNEWLRTSPEHVRAYLRVSAFWQEAGQLDGKQRRDIEALVAQANEEANVFPLAFGPQVTETAAGHRAPRAPAFFSPNWRFAAIAVTLVLAIAAFGIHQHLTRDIYETRIGEQRTVNLPDGSTLILNADSRVRVRYSKTDRTVHLDEGQALFKVAKNPARPFIVRSGEASVRAVGTQFDVYRKSTGITVTVVEGKVAAATPYEINPVFLGAGEQLVIPEIAIAAVKVRKPEPQVRPVKIEEATAWTAGLLIFDGAPLADVIQEFNRQNTKPIVLERDAELSALEISGTFPASGSERITSFLHARFGVVVHESDDEIRLSRP